MGDVPHEGERDVADPAHGRPVEGDQPADVAVEIHDHDPAWATQFADVGRALRDALGDRAVRIDHIGSTSVPGLAAKPIIDVQISVEAFEPFDLLREPIEEQGLRWKRENPDRNKRFFQGRFRGPVTRGAPDVNLHVRWSGTFSEQANLLFRDYLRTHDEARDRYAAFKRQLAARRWETVNHYAAAKTEVIWPITYDAYSWEQTTGWRAGPSDA
jgi:GrpB-like predicted nucleotidyltransferase (UPF0157 family)